MKSNKSLKKRIKLTKKGDLLARCKGQDHFNAKESRVDQYGKSKYQKLKLFGKAKAKLLAALK